jgi:hypothetical protein
MNMFSWKTNLIGESKSTSFSLNLYMILPLIPFIINIESCYDIESLTLTANIFESKYL